jgi:hypothetical protein
LDSIISTSQISLYEKFFPQQLPGPAQPATSPGDDPQQAVSLIPGMVFFTCPDIEDGVERSFVVLLLPQNLHCRALSS